jgi:MscS family membrane protein
MRGMKVQNLVVSVIVVAIMTIVLGSALTAPVNARPGDIHIYSPDEYSKNVNMDETVIFIWSAYNNGSNPHQVFIELSPGDNGWTAELNEYHFELLPQEFHVIELTITAPNSRDYPEFSYYMNASVRDFVTGENWYEPIGVAASTITGGAYLPPTKALGFIPNFFAELGIDSLDNEWGVFLVSLLFWFLIGLIIFFVLDPFVKLLTKKTETKIDDEILAIVKGPIFGLIVIYGVVSSIKVLNVPWSWVNTMELLYAMLVIMLVAWMAFKILKDVLLIWGKAYSEKTDTEIDDIMLPLFEKVGMIVIIIIAIIAILNLLGIDVTMLVAGMGVMGLVIAFAAQDTLGNFISGMFLLTDRPFKVGDLVLMENGDYCRVEHIGMRSTKLYNTFDHDVIILPNSKIANEKVINLTEPDNKMKIQVIMGVDYSTDINQAKDIMLTIAKTHKGVMQEEGHSPFVRVVEFADSAIMIKLYAWVYHLTDQWKVASELREEMFYTFKKVGIEIPFPQRVVHMEKDASQANPAPGPERTRKGLDV